MFMLKRSCAVLAAALTMAGCGEGPVPEGGFPGDRYISLELNGDTVIIPAPAGTDPSAPGDFSADVRRDIGFPVPDSLVQGEDSLTFSRLFPLGGGSVLVLTGVAGDASRVPLVRRMLTQSSLRRWHGLREVVLSDVSPDSIDRLRNEPPREEPLYVNHRLHVVFQPAVAESSLFLVDTVSFRGRDGVTLNVNRGVPGNLDALNGMVEQTGQGSWLCLSDSSQVRSFTGVFTCVLPRNWHIADEASGELLGRCRMSSALLGGRYLPSSEHPNRFEIQVHAPQGMSVYSPLSQVFQPVHGGAYDFSTGTGLVRGTVPVFIGEYSEYTLSDRRSRLLVQAGIDQEHFTEDSLWADNMGMLLQSMLGFPGSSFSILVAEGGTEAFSVPYHGCLVVSPGVLSTLSGVFSWGDSLAAGAQAAGTGVVAAGAECFTLQSIFIDPVLARMIQAWMPCRFLDFMSVSEDLFKMRRAYRNYYLYQTGITGGLERALADPGLAGSPLYEPVVRGKGPMVLEYLHSQGCLDHLPNLLDNLRHSGNYWNKLWANLGLYEGERRFRLLRQFLYQPGIPQVSVEWWTEDGLIRLEPVQMQPSAQFGVLFRSCKLFLEDGSSRQVILNPGDSNTLYAVLPPEASVGVAAVDLNPEQVIPADIVYRRRIPGGE